MTSKVPAPGTEAVASLLSIASQIRDVPDGGPIVLEIRRPRD